MKVALRLDRDLMARRIDLRLPVVVVHKTRVSGTEVVSGSIIGDVRGRTPLIVDDMISTGETIAKAAQAVRAAGASSELYVAASHGPLIARAVSVLAELGIARLVTSDSVRTPALAPFPRDTVSLAPLLADAIRHLAHRDGSLVAR